MAKVKQVLLCKNCKTELDANTNECPVCGYVLKAHSSGFDTPDYISFQAADRLEILSKSTPKLKSETKSETAPKDLEKETLETYRDVKRWFRDCADGERSAAVQDAHSVLTTLIISNASVDTMRDVTNLGKKIGKLSEAVELFISQGGNHGLLKSARPASNKEGDGEIGEFGDLSGL